MRIPLAPIFFVIAVSVLAVIHTLALQYFLYFLYPWLDIPMHLLGGAVIVLGLFSLRSLGIRLPARYFTFLPTLLLVVVVGLLWEIFEIWVGIPLIQANFEMDIAADLLCDIMGGTIGYIVVTNIEKL